MRTLRELATAIHRLASAIEQLIAAVTQASREANTAKHRDD